MKASALNDVVATEAVTSASEAAVTLAPAKAAAAAEETPKCQPSPKELAETGAWTYNKHPTSTAELDEVLAKIAKMPKGALVQRAKPKIPNLSKPGELLLRGRSSLCTSNLHSFDFGLSVEPVFSKLKAVQRYITSLEYNFTGRTYVIPHKSRGFAGVCRVAKDLMRESLPIKCLEAVFVGSALTIEVEGVERFPVRFRSKAGGQVFLHIVLAVFVPTRSMSLSESITRRRRDSGASGEGGGSSGVWGAIGLSRKDTLASKPFRFESLSALMEDYKEVGWTLFSAWSGSFIAPLRHSPDNHSQH